ncbi:MAG: asparagine--tRNA ligase, partial [Bacilli bacterium]|nr:asparagine--tRNA ligase [Bacilli bacterium]
MYLNELWKKKEDFLGKEIVVKGWIRNHRPQKEFGFIDFSDGTCFKHLQIVYDKSNDNFLEYTKLSNGSSIEVKGTLIKSEGKG